MTNIIKFAKELTLSAEEKALMKTDLINQNKEWTEIAWEILQQKLLDDNKDYFVDIANKKLAEDKE